MTDTDHGPAFSARSGSSKLARESAVQLEFSLLERKSQKKKLKKHKDRRNEAEERAERAEAENLWLRSQLSQRSAHVRRAHFYVRMVRDRANLATGCLLITLGISIALGFALAGLVPRGFREMYLAGPTFLLVALGVRRIAGVWVHRSQIETAERWLLLVAAICSIISVGLGVRQW